MRMQCTFRSFHSKSRIHQKVINYPLNVPAKGKCNIFMCVFVFCNFLLCSSIPLLYVLAYDSARADRNHKLHLSSIL